MRVPSRSRSPVNVAPDSRTIWHNASPPLSAGPMARAFTIGTSAQKGEPRAENCGSSQARRFHRAASRSATVCLRRAKRGRLDDRFGAVRAPVRDIVGVGSQLPPSLPPVSNLCPRLHSDLHIPHRCFSPVGNLAVRQTQVRLSRFFRSTSQLSPTPSSTRVAGCAVLGDSKPIHAAERPDLRCLSPRAPGPREKPRCT